MPITLDNVSYIYAPGTPFEAAALHGLSLTIEDGEYVGIMGQTGCGKSTLIQLLAGLLPPASGRILLDGLDINGRGYNRDTLRRSVGIVFQYPEYQLFETTVEKDVAFGLRHSGLSKEEIARNVRWAIETVGFNFEAVRALSPLSLSGGEKRRIAIAGVLAVKPRILILDEPIAGLDPLGREAFLALTKDLNHAGTTIIMVSHNADALSETAGRILVLEAGRLIMDGPAKAIFRDAEMLFKRGIGISQSREIAYLLNKCGYDVPQDIIRYEELLPYLVAVGKGRGL
ncbi:MAG: energy-coupling factor transporter ATPase [Oscillospiraceae bacterium]